MFPLQPFQPGDEQWPFQRRLSLFRQMQKVVGVCLPSGMPFPTGDECLSSILTDRFQHQEALVLLLLTSSPCLLHSLSKLLSTSEAMPSNTCPASSSGPA